MKTLLAVPLYLLLCVLISSCFGCREEAVQHLERLQFKPPFVKETNKLSKGEFFKASRIMEVWPRFVGQYNFADTIVFNGERQVRDGVSEQQFRWERSPFDFDTLSSDGLEIIADYPTSIKAKETPNGEAVNVYYPVYIVNNTNDPKVFVAKDNYVFGIQEALDTASFKSFHAIEGMGFDFCGYGYFRRKILPRQFILVLFPKYEGTYETYLRTRLRIGDNVFVSKPFIGRIDEKQFNLTKEAWFYNDIKKMSYGTYKWMFYGAKIRDTVGP